MSMITSKGKLGVGIILSCVALMTVANVVFTSMNDTISSYLGTSQSSGDDESYTMDELYEQGVETSKDIQGEGTVLLKNNGVLPLAQGTEVSLLGSMSINYVIGGTGSGGGADDEYTIMLKDALEESGLSVNEDLYDWLAQALGNTSGENLTHIAASSNYGVDGAGSNGSSAAWNSATTSELELSSSTYTSWLDRNNRTATSCIGDSDTAIVTFARTGAEGASLTVDKDGDGSAMTGTTYLELTTNERDLLKYCKENFENTIVLINSASPMELGFIDNENYDVDACLWIGHPGEAGMLAVADILAGNINPSGSLVDTFAYDMSTLPGYYGNGDTRYTNLADYPESFYTTGAFLTNGTYLYFENIYVGYRFYETADAEGYFDSSEFKNTNFKNDASDPLRTEEQLADGGSLRSSEGGYENVVQFPFGYGLSYTTFTQEITSSNIPLQVGGTNTITVEVTNTGDVAGKTAVQLYLEAPYNQDSSLGIQGRGLEKSSKVLIAFDKTEEIEPNESVTLTLSFDTDEITSYDYTGQHAYVLEQGEYTFHLGDDAHTSFDSVSATLDETYVYNEEGVGKRDSDATVATNHLDDVSAGDGNLTASNYLSRSNFASGMETLMKYTPGEGEGLNLQLGEEQTRAVTTTGTNSYEYTYTYYENGVEQTGTKTLYNQASTNSFNATETPEGLSLNDESYRVTMGSTATSYTLADMYDADTGLALDFDDPLWDDLLDQMTLDELVELQGHEGWGRSAIESIGSPEIEVRDGPQEANNGSLAQATWWPSEIVIAATFNTDLAEEMGTIYGNQASQAGLAGSYAPAMDTHRSPFGGRNFEYYSEDGFIAGKMGARTIVGIQSTGTMIYIKHFMLNDNDDNRNGAFTFCNEQAIREVYGKPFEIAIKEANALGMMASLNRIGMSSEHYGLYVDIVRNEWDFKGFLITDGLGPMADAGQALFNTPSICLASLVSILDKGNTLVTSSQYVAIEGSNATTTLYGQYMLRLNAKYALYQAVASGDINRSLIPNHIWWIAWVAIDVILGAAIILAYIFMVHKGLVLPLVNQLRKKKD